MNKKCSLCNKKSYLGITCECGLYFCMKHRYTYLHNCIKEYEKNKKQNEQKEKELKKHQNECNKNYEKL